MNNQNYNTIIFVAILVLVVSQVYVYYKLSEHTSFDGVMPANGPTSTSTDQLNSDFSTEMAEVVETEVSQEMVTGTVTSVGASTIVVETAEGMSEYAVHVDTDIVFVQYDIREGSLHSLEEEQIQLSEVEIGQNAFIEVDSTGAAIKITVE